jgi:hypothetical protein
MSDVIPGIYGKARLGKRPFFDGHLFSNTKLRCGEVFEVISPKSKSSISKLFYEYNVLVPQYESGTVGTRLYRNCILMNGLAGGADHSKWKLRASTKPLTEAGKTDGSRVLVLCIEGSNNQAVIIGGLPDERAVKDDESKGHQYEFEFNGVNFQVNDDGSFICKQKGKTTNLGEADKDRNKGAGTSIEVKANGTYIVSTKDDNQSITIDNSNNTIKIQSDKKVTVQGDKIELGTNASDPAVLGNELVSILKELLGALQIMTMASVAGSPLPLTSPPLNAFQFASISARLDKILSDQTFLKS